MSDAQIVSCPGCSKRYSVPGGVPPGQFQCQDCSAVVVYGRGGAATGGNGPPKGGEAQPRGGKPAGSSAKSHAAGSAKSHAKAASAKRKTARNRRDEEEDEDDRPARGGAKKKDNSVYLMAIAGAVVFVVIAIVVVVQMNKGKAKPAPAPTAPGVGAPVKEVGTFTASEEPEEKPAPTPAPAPAPTPAPRTAPAPATPKDDAEPKPSGGIKATLQGGVTDKGDSFTPAANPPTGSHYGKNQAALLLLLREKHAEAWVDPGHLPDTSSDLAQKIDADVAKMADVNGGSDSFKAQDRLIKIGRPAIPKVVGLLSHLDFSKYSSMQDARDACVIGDAIDHVLREITGYDKIVQLQYSPLDGKLSQYTQSLDEWCVWWFTIGFKRETFYKKAGAAEEEKL